MRTVRLSVEPVRPRWFVPGGSANSRPVSRRRRAAHLIRWFPPRPLRHPVVPRLSLSPGRRRRFAGCRLRGPIRTGVIRTGLIWPGPIWSGPIWPATIRCGAPWLVGGWHGGLGRMSWRRGAVALRWLNRCAVAAARSIRRGLILSGRIRSGISRSEVSWAVGPLCGTIRCGMTLADWTRSALTRSVEFR